MNLIMTPELIILYFSAHKDFAVCLNSTKFYVNEGIQMSNTLTYILSTAIRLMSAVRPKGSVTCIVSVCTAKAHILMLNMGD